MANEVIPFGYGAFIAEPDGGIAHLDALMADPRRVLVDIRLVPYSSAKFPMWHKGSLADRYGCNAHGKSRYIHGSALGNLNYRPEDRNKGFELKAKRIGLDKLKSFLSAGYQPILLCGCRDYTYCHRAFVVQFLAAEVPGLIVTHPEQRETPDNVAVQSVAQAALFEVAAVVEHFDKVGGKQ